MSKSTRVNTKKRPPVTGTLVGIRLQPDLLAALDKFAELPKVSRPEAARQLITLGLALYSPTIDMLDALEIAKLLGDKRLAPEVSALEKGILAHHEGAHDAGTRPEDLNASNDD